MSDEKTWTDASIVATIREVVAEQLDVAEDAVTMEAKFQHDLGADSLALVELIMALEDKFDLESISDEDASTLVSVADVVSYIKQRKGL
ncbi:MAG TPA: acyl carrier protein [Armatimonadota bacterium]|nr:acyl carrier protein [Armatimonadota bacterium]